MLCVGAACSHAAGSNAVGMKQGPAVFSSVPVGVLPMPSGLHVTPPAAGLAPQVAAFSGTWQGRWGGLLPSRLIVERVTTTQAQVVYVWGAFPGYFRAGWQRVDGAITPDYKLQLDQGGVRFVFTMSADRKSLAGERVAQFNDSTITMTRVGV